VLKSFERKDTFFLSKFVLSKALFPVSACFAGSAE
jgi:hypothetical protein